MGRATGIPVSNEALRRHAEELLTRPVALDDLALAFDEASAASAGGPRRGPTSTRRCSPTSRPPRRPSTSTSSASGRARSATRSPRRWSRRRRRAFRSGSSSTGRAPTRERGRELLRPARRRRASRSCVVRATQAAGGPRAARRRRRPVRWNLRALGHIDHRKVVVVDGRIGWVGGAGIEDHFEDGRFHDLFLRVDGPGRLAAAARLRRELPLARRRRFRPTSSTGSSPTHDGAGEIARGRAAQRAGPVPADHRRDRASCSTARARRSTSSTRTSPTAA